MGNFTTFIAWIGFISALGLCLLDGVTSYLGIRISLGGPRDNAMTMVIPAIVAVLALCFNGLSAHMFRMYKAEKFSSFAPTVTSIMWVTFVGYDFVSSFIGILDLYSPVRISSWATMVEGMERLGGVAGFLVILISLLLSFGPFLCCMFYDLATTPDKRMS